MPHRADILTGLPRQLALALAITGMLASAAPAAGVQTVPPTPRELWRAYPLQGAKGGAVPRIRLPAGSAAARGTARPVASARSGDGGGAPTVPIAIAVGLAALACGLLLGRRRRVAMAGAEAAPVAETPPAPPPPAAPEDEAARAEPLRVAPEPPEPPEPEPLRAAPPPSPPPPPEPAPEPLHAARALAPPSALDLEVERLRTGRFERQPWPPETERSWRCEIGWHAGTLSSAFRAMAAPPGRRRAKEVGRSAPQRLWGAAPPEPATAALVAAADGLAAALLDAGWERVEGGGEHWYATRFTWSHEEPPPRGLRVRSTTEEEVVHDA